MKTVFVASSKKFYGEAKKLQTQLEAAGVKTFCPYFDVDADNSFAKKKNVTLKHLPEIDASDVVYVVAKKGYVGHSVTIEVAYAFAKRKEIVSSQPIGEFAVRALVSRVMKPNEFVKYALS